ncbi:hypothetical protein H103_05651 [Trichophyton rubrum CBS 288.86]|uniref:Uncharacterized protein n=1 Tax=Trichophyton rubrum CBS 288.86 TaxID=1215330 RepID=A0A022VYK6_TRIRU|nr:hypothetical protein H102_05624 [Trichophyton rubrum CBS 100081]EZF50823.1 hypothetical protein H103_05651 [Trichophyton rubrum CBS 288.86]EZF82963.1 hypothetical protein H110_05646 [Trichophyton rubrum MR1448]EZG15126.1 hypothetical protein H107_05787 [Trichophyton rubrum CBS 202.88]
MGGTSDIEVNDAGSDVPGDTFISLRDGTANDVQDMKRMGKQQQLQVSEQSSGLVGSMSYPAWNALTLIVF